MPPAPRNRKATLDTGPVIWIAEKRYPGNRFEFPRDKWIYVLHQKAKETPRLVDQIYAGKQGWRRMYRSFRGKRLRATRRNSRPVPAQRYHPPSPRLLRGQLCFYLSPIPLGPQALEWLAKLSEAEHKDIRITIEDEFARLRELARAKGSKTEHRIVWGRAAYGKGYAGAPPEGFATVRASFNFDAQGRRFKPGSKLSKPPPWEHVVLLEDPQAWIEEIHEHGVLFARDLLLKHQQDPRRLQMRFIAHSIASEIRRNKDKRLDDEMLELPFDKVPSFREHDARVLVDEDLRKRLGWRRYKVETATARTSAKGRVTHRVAVPPDDWKDACNGSRSPNIAELYLNLDDLRLAAYVQNMERFVAELRSYMFRNPRYAVLCADHTDATQALDSSKEAKSPAKRMALRASVGGLVHSCSLLSGLHHCPGGRKLIKKLSTWSCRRKVFQLPSGEEASPEINSHILAQGLFDGSQAFFTKKLWDNTAKRAIKSCNLFIESTLAGMLDDSFHAAFTKRPATSRVYAWVDRLYSKMVTVDSDDIANRAVDRYGKRLFEVHKNYGSMESHILQEKALVCQSSRTTYAKLNAFLALIDGLAAVEKIIRRCQDPSTTGQVAGSVRDVAYVADAVTKSWKLFSDTKALQSAGKMIGFIGSFLDVVLSLQAAHKARNPKVKLGYFCQAVGAGAAFVGTVWALANGAAVSGPVGWAIAGAYLVGYVVGQIFIWLFSFEGWRDATALCFLGKKKTGKPLGDLHLQYKRWQELYAAFEVIIDDRMHVTIKPGTLVKGDRFACEFTGRRPRQIEELKLGQIEVEILGRRSLDHSNLKSVSLYNFMVGKNGWTSEIELRLIGVEEQSLKSVTASVKLRSKSRGLTLPLGNESLLVTLKSHRSQVSPVRRWDRMAKGVADIHS